ncbi:MAG: TonB-dependent receptor plug domain-containing protein [Rhodospirillales bacterium]
MQDIVSEVPEADFRTSASNKDRTLFVRGIGTISTSPGVEPSVSTVVDGVVLARSGQATLDLVDLAQVEVLGGPQGTLFGKNASAASSTSRRPRPKRDFHAWVEADYFGSGGNAISPQRRRHRRPHADHQRQPVRARRRLRRQRAQPVRQQGTERLPARRLSVEVPVTSLPTIWMLRSPSIT